MELTNIAMTLNFNEICRLCMSEKTKMLPLFVQEDSLSEKIKAFIPSLKLCSGDGLPAQVCSHCIQQSINYEVNEMKEEPEESQKAIKTEKAKSSSRNDQNSDNKNDTNSDVSTCQINSTTKKRFPCEECGKPFSGRGDLKRHMLTHSGERAFPCKFCEKKFSLKGSLHAHYKIHSNEKPFECEKCDAKFSLQLELKKHKESHIQVTEPMGKKFVCHICDVKPFMCSECGKTFSRNDRLKDHLSSHTGKRPFSCPHCGKGFVRKEHLKYHLNSTHKLKSHEPYNITDTHHHLSKYVHYHGAYHWLLQNDARLNFIYCYYNKNVFKSKIIISSRV
ncbi:hypothetical protein C0J52_08876 [Blattella germanica]|nr:hypothetical protein C0J52_08876 [Blattella germanica]